MSKFQLIFTGIFILFIVAGVTAFATYKSSSETAPLPTIEVWGTFSGATVSQLLQELNQMRAQQLQVVYVEKTVAAFNKDFIEALARGSGPDAVLLPQDMLLRHRDKMLMIPYTTVTQRSFMDTYVQEAEKYLDESGVLGLPFTIDPLVMYVNKDMFTNAGIATYPRQWDEFNRLNALLTQKDDRGNIRRSAVALGEFSNLTHAREILGTILMQAGNPVTVSVDGGIRSALGYDALRGSETTSTGLSFFNQFSNPTSQNYSWNRSLPSSKNSFLGGKLATYFGFASEIEDIRAKNPNLNFDIAAMPQPKIGAVRTTYGTMYGFSLVRSSKDPGTAYTVLSALTAADALALLEKVTYLPPVRRDMIARGTTDPYLAIFYDSGLIARDWLDPDSTRTSDILQTMVESVTSGQRSVYDAVKYADAELNLLIQNM